jgi:outer membrane protein assembly factor BamB
MQIPVDNLRTPLPTGGTLQEQPTLVTVGGQKQLACFGQKDLVGINPADGKTIWTMKENYETQYGVNATMPIFHEGKLFVSWAYSNGGCAMYELSPTGAKKLWGNKNIAARYQPGILDNGVLYVNSEGTLKAMDWNSGNVLWSQRINLGPGGSLIRYEDMLLCLTERGTLVLGKATKEGFTKTGEIKSAVEGKFVWSAPTIYNGRLYVKGEDELVCFEFGGQ